MEVSIYIKTRFHGNPRGQGKAASVLEYIGKNGEAHTRVSTEETGDGTKNALELALCVKTLARLNRPCEVIIYTENFYIMNALKRGWMDEWQGNSWKKKDGSEPANVGLWKEFYLHSIRHQIDIRLYEDKYEEKLSHWLA